MVAQPREYWSYQQWTSIITPRTEGATEETWKDVLLKERATQ